MRTQKTLLVSFLCASLGICSGCANRNAYNPYPTQYPQQYQAYPFTGQQVQPGQPGQQIQPSPMVGQAPPGAIQPGMMQPGGMQPGYGTVPAGFAQGPQQLPYYPQPGQPAPGYFGQQGPAPFLGR